MTIRCDECGESWRGRAAWVLYLRYWMHVLREFVAAILR